MSSNILKCRELKESTYISTLVYLMETKDVLGLFSFREELEAEERYCECAGVQAVIELVDNINLLNEIGAYGEAKDKEGFKEL